MNRKIAVVTGTRAEFGLLAPLMKEIRGTDGLDLQLIVTGAHLSREHGFTFKEILKEGFTIDRKVDMRLGKDSPEAIASAMGRAVTGFGKVFAELRPDITVILGDRYEILAAAEAALVTKTPVAHLHGGELTEGAMDDSMRHAITKMSHLHFTSTEEYRRRVIQMGEQPDRVFNVGAIGLDNIRDLKLLTKDELERALGIRFQKKNLLVTFHPATLGDRSAEDEFDEILAALDQLADTLLIFTKANADPGGLSVNRKIDQYARSHPEKSAAFTSLGQLRYLSAMRWVDAVVGNSSSGIIEAPSFKIGTLNFGDRQKGRVRADSVIDCETDRESIKKGINTLYSDAFQGKLKDIVNPYGYGQTAVRIVKTLKKTDLNGILTKKFHDIRF